MAEVLSTCFLNNEFQDTSSAQVSVLDRGFIFGDAVYEVIPVCDGVVFGLDEHLARLTNSLAAIRMQLPRPSDGWRSLIYELLTRNGGGNQSIYIQITRGVAPREHAISTDTKPTLLMFAMRASDLGVNPVAVISATDPRWQHCNIKATSLLANVLLRSDAQDKQAYETILFRDGLLTEGAASNVFVVIGETIYTPRADNQILPGITRQFLIDALAGSELEVQELDVSEEMFSKASEIWLTSSTRDLVPVVSCNSEPVGSGEIGPVFDEVAKLYAKFKSSALAAERERSPHSA